MLKISPYVIYYDKISICITFLEEPVELLSVEWRMISFFVGYGIDFAVHDHHLIADVQYLLSQMKNFWFGHVLSSVGILFQPTMMMGIEMLFPTSHLG